MDLLRHLQFDDFLILDGLLRGLTLTDLAAKLSLTQPALSHRLKKMAYIFGGKLVEKNGRKIILSPLGLKAARRASQTLEIFAAQKPKEQAALEIRLGSRLDIATDWIFPRLFVKRRLPYTCHLYQGTGDEIFHLLQRGFLDAIVTSSPVIAQPYRQIVLKEECYFLCARPDLAKKIRRVTDLSGFALIEHDPTYPFRRYWPEIWRRASFKNVLFLGSTQMMATALTHGLGIGVIPDFVAEPLFKAKKLKRVLPQHALSTDTFRLVFAETSPMREQFETLATLLA